MPEICRFLGILILIYYKDHSPSHFHAKYSDKSGTFSINDMRMIEGDLPPRVISLILEWALINKSELLEDWELAQSGKPLKKIAPLV